MLPKSIGWGVGGRGGIETAGGSHEKTYFKGQPKRMKEAENATPTTCRHRCPKNSFQLKIESGHLATNMRFIFDFEPDWYTDQNNQLKRIRTSNQVSTPPAS